MPFTPAHTAVVLPFLRWRHLSATGLVVGSVAPDFEYFLKFSVDGIHGHTWAGLVYYDLPLTAVLSLLFHHLAARNLILSMPPFIQSRFIDVLDTPFLTILKTKPITFIVSALIGSASHILWDAFTHGNGFFVGYFSFYDDAFVPFDGVNYPLWYALQYISTFVGLAIVVVYLIAKKGRPALTSGKLSYWIVLIAITLIAMAIRFQIRSSDMNLGNVVVSAISGLCLGLLFCGAIPFWKNLKAKGQP